MDVAGSFSRIAAADRCRAISPVRPPANKPALAEILAPAALSRHGRFRIRKHRHTKSGRCERWSLALTGETILERSGHRLA